MDFSYLRELLPDVEEDALNSILSTHQQEKFCNEAELRM